MVAPMKERGKWICLVLVLGLVGLGAFLRLYHLGRALLWIDEITITWFAALPRTVGQIFREIYAADMQGFTGQHMPIQYAMLNLFYHAYSALGIVDFSEFLTRLPFALTGIAALPLMYLTAKRYFNSKSTALWALFLLSISFFHVMKSRDATGYAPLILFILLNSYGAVGIMLPEAGCSNWKKTLFLIAFLLGTLGAFLTHLTSWLYLAPEGMILVGCIGWPIWKKWRAGHKFTDLIRQNIWGIALVLLLLISALCFIRFPLAVTKGHGIHEDVRESLGLAHFVYQIAHFSWGKGGGRLISAVVVFFAALILGWKKCRLKMIWVSVLTIMPAFLIAVLNFRGFHPRYLSVILPAYLALLALGFSCAQEALSQRIKYKHIQEGFAGVVILLFIIWLWGPYRALFAMHTKAFPIYETRETLLSVIEPETPYIWQNAFQARQLGQAYAIPDHACINGMYPNGTGEPRQQFLMMDHYFQIIARSVPTAPMIIDHNDRFFFDSAYQWPKSYYKRKIAVEREPWLRKLHDWGFEHVGYDPDGFDYYIYYNTTEDIVEQVQSVQGLAVWPVGKKWHFQRLPNGITIMVNDGPSELKLVNFKPGCEQGRLRVTGFAAQNGSLMLTGPGLPPNGIFASFGPSANQAVTLELPGIPLRSGTQIFTFSVFPQSQQPVFFPVTFELVEN
jgi:hypothetical protein